jgi:LysM repeat protein
MLTPMRQLWMAGLPHAIVAHHLVMKCLRPFLLASAMAIGSVVSVAASPVAAACERPYVAVANDSWSRIATKAGVSVKALLQANSASTKTMILVGETVCLPKGTTWNQPSTQASGLRNLGTPSTRYTRAQAAAVIREVFPKRLHERALAIAQRESKLNALSYTWCCVGLFQINWWAHKSWLKNIGVTKAAQLRDARVNAKAALEMYKRNSGWGPWE